MTESKPSLTIHAHVDSYGQPNDDWKKKEIPRLRKEIKVIKNHLKNWDHEKIGKIAKSQLEEELNSKEKQLKEYSGKTSNKIRMF